MRTGRSSRVAALRRRVNVHCGRIYASKWAKEYHAKMLRKIKVGISDETKQSILEFNAEDGVIVLHCVSYIRRFYRIKEGDRKDDEARDSDDQVLPIIARSRVSFQLRPVISSQAPHPFFQEKSQLFDIELRDARLEVPEKNPKETIIRDLSPHCSKKLCDGMLMGAE